MLFHKQEKKIIFWLSLVLFFRMFSVFLVLPIFNILAQELQASNFFLIGLAFGIYGLTQGIFQLPFGYLSDLWGRKKMLLIALSFFVLGSLLASFTDNIWTMIVARLLQGVGAVASILFALLADNTRDEVRARATAFLGGGVGIAFCLAFVFAPVLSIWMDIQGIFRCILLLAVLSWLAVFFFVPETTHPPKKNPFLSALKQCLKNTQLQIIYFGSFLSGVGLSSSLFVTQVFLFNYLHFPKEELWKIYLSMLLISCLFLFPVTFYAEKKSRFDHGILLAMGFVMTAFILFWWGTMQYNFWFLVVALISFFIGYSIFEPIFPSLVTRWSNPDTKGTASGVYNLLQFLGHFVGAIFSGFLIEKNLFYLYLVLLLLSCLFLYFFGNFQNPIKKTVSNESH